MTIILGIDPGSRLTGYGVIRAEKNVHTYIASGCIRVTAIELGQRLQQIFAGLQEIIQTYQPVEAAIEQIFMHQNPGSALKLGQARGVAIVAAATAMIPIAEYSARQIKQATVGHGAAKKEQVQHMVRILLNLSGVIQADAADALGVALCHANVRTTLAGEGEVKGIGFRRGRKKNVRSRSLSAYIENNSVVARM